MPSQAKIKVVWSPQPGPQTMLLRCPVFEILFGGSRGGGKTDGMLGDFVKHAGEYGEDAIGLCVRRERTQLKEMIERSRQIYAPIGAKYSSQDKQWRFPNGARLTFAYLENDSDAEAYQGWNTCVSLGTRIKMADGSLKTIESISRGEMVLTLEGPKRVLKTVAPYQASCVRALVRDGSGAVVGEQLHPVWHPVLTTSGATSLRKTRKLQSVLRFSFGRDGIYRQAAEPRLGGHREIPAWFSWSEDGRSADRSFAGGTQAAQPPQRLIVPVALHGPSPQSGSCGRLRRFRRVAKQSRFPGKWCRLWLSELQGIVSLYSGRLRRAGLVRSALGLFGLFQPTVFYCAPQHSNRVQGSTGHYSLGPRRDGEPAPLRSENAQYVLPSQEYVAGTRHASPLDELGTTPTHNPSALQSWVHPYTGQERRLVEQVHEGTMELELCGDAWVSDLCVEDANHYISECGLVNKNTRIYVEEMGNFPRPEPIFKLMATLRSGNPNVKVGFRATANPGGPGHLWIRARYIDPAPFGLKILTDKFTNPFTKEESAIERVYIPSKVTDNRFCNNNEYISRLQMAAGTKLLHAWLHGDWNLIEGAFFSEWDESKHVIEPFEIPDNWTRFMSADWGSAAPFSIGWWAVVSDDYGDPFGPMSFDDGKAAYKGQLPPGAIVRYREWYGSPNHNNTGLKLFAEEVAAGIVERERDEPRNHSGGARISYRVIDPDACREKGGPSIAERMSWQPNRIFWRPADNARVGRRGAMGGWDAVRARLKGEGGKPMLYVFNNCIDLIRCLPVAQHDPDNMEDIDDCEDHVIDDLRYACMSRPYISSSDAKKQDKFLTIGADNKVTLNDILEQYDHRTPKSYERIR